MPARAISLESAFIAGALAAAASLGLNATAASAVECFDNPSSKTDKPGHWYYHSDRTRDHRCWFFVPAEVTADTPASAPPAAPAGPAAAPPVAPVAGDSRQSWLPFFIPGTSIPGTSIPGTSQPPPPPPQQTEALQTQPNTIPDRSGEPAQTISPKPARPKKTVRREQPQVTPPPTTTGAADRRDQPEQHDQPEQSVSDTKQDSPLNVVDREKLFQDFLKWQTDRSLFGSP